MGSRRLCARPPFVATTGGVVRPLALEVRLAPLAAALPAASEVGIRFL
jgi:hypothetical protein